MRRYLARHKVLAVLCGLVLVCGATLASTVQWKLRRGCSTLFLHVGEHVVCVNIAALQGSYHGSPSPKQFLYLAPCSLREHSRALGP